MADTIKIGNLDISAFKVGSDNCKIYLGDTLLYPQAVNNMFVGNYTGGNQYTIECSTSTALTRANVEAAPYAKSTLLSAEVSACGHDTFKIGDNAFSGATSMSAITIDDNVTQFGNQAFLNTKALKSITFPSKLDTIQGSCFRFSGIRRISGIPSGVTYLSSGCFADMYSLSAATIPSSVTGSSTNLFLRDSGLTEVHFERTTAPALGTDAFKNCTALTKIYIPNCNCFNSYAAQSQFSGLTNIIYAEGTNTKCQTYTPSIKMATANGWTSSANTSGNLVRINKSASSTGELTTCSISVSGVSKIVFTLYLSNYQSGINYSSSKDSYATSTTIKSTSSGSNTWTLDGLTKGNKYTIRCKLIARSGTYVSGTAAGANISWTS